MEKVSFIPKELSNLSYPQINDVKNILDFDLMFEDTEHLYHAFMYSLVSHFFPVSIQYLQCIHCLLLYFMLNKPHIIVSIVSNFYMKLG